MMNVYIEFIEPHNLIIHAYIYYYSVIHIHVYVLYIEEM